jgi:hypothetical protein
MLQLRLIPMAVFRRRVVQSVEDLLRLGSERELKAAGLHRTEGRSTWCGTGTIVVRFSV